MSRISISRHSSSRQSISRQSVSRQSNGRHSLFTGSIWKSSFSEEKSVSQVKAKKMLAVDDSSFPQELVKLATFERLVANLTEETFDDATAYANELKDITVIARIINVVSQRLCNKIDLYDSLLHTIASEFGANINGMKFHPMLDIRLKIRGCIIKTTKHEDCKSEETKSIYNFFQSIYSGELGVVPDVLKDFYSAEDIANDDFRILRSIIDHGYPTNSLGFYLRYDEIDELNKFSSHSKFDWNQKLYCYINKRFELQPLVNICAYYGSLNCFKHCINNKAKIDHETARCSIFGGNFDIIRTLEQGSIDFSDLIEVAVDAHRNNVVEWMLSKYRNKSFDVAPCARTLNFQALVHSLENNNSILSFVERFGEKKQAIHYAAQYGIAELVSYLFEKGAEADSYTADKAPIIYAAEINHLESVKILFENGADVNARTIKRRTERFEKEYGYSALHYATINQNLEMVSFLVDNGADVDISTENDRTPVQLACAKGNIGIIKCLVENGCELSGSKYGETPLQTACINNNLEVTKYLVESGSDIDAYTGGVTPLHVSCVANSVDVAKFLIERGADVDAYTSYSDPSCEQMNPLLFAAQSNSIEIVRLLVEFGRCLINIKSINSFGLPGRQALHFACANGNVKLVRYLVECGVELHSKTRFSKTALHYACESGSYECVQYLISNNVDITEKAGFFGDKTALHYAVQSGNFDIVKLLVSMGVDVNAKTREFRERTLKEFWSYEKYERKFEGNKTPLHIACENGFTKIANYLINNGATVDIKSQSLRTPFHYACENGHIQTADLLLKRGADINNRNVKEMTSLMLSQRRNYIDMYNFLISKGAKVDARSRIRL